MPCAVASSSALASGTRTNSTVTAPSGIADGDILVYGMEIGGAAGGPTATPPTGFAAPTGIPVAWSGSGIGDSYGLRIYFWTKKADSESGNYTATHASGDTTAFMWRITGGDQTTWVDQAATTQSHNGGGSGHNVIDAPTLTPTVDGCALLWIGVSWDAFGAATPTTGWTERRNVTTEVLYAQDLIQTTAAATGTISVTSTQGGDRPEGAAMLAIRASAGAAAPGASALNARIPHNRVGPMALRQNYRRPAYPFDKTIATTGNRRRRVLC